MRKIKYFKFTIVMSAIILAIILTPGDSVPSVGIPGIDKVIHMGMFFMLSGIYSLEYRVYKKIVPKILDVLLKGGIFATTTEVMQLFAIKRSFDVQDIIADIVGVILGFIIIKLVGKHYKGGKGCTRE